MRITSWLPTAVITLLAAPLALAQTTPSAPGAASPAAAADKPAPSAADKEHDELVRYARNHGFKPSTKNGQPQWCKTEPQIGSKLDRTICESEPALADEFRAYRDHSGADWHPSACNTPGCSSH
jgi:hypothetical protein